MGKLADCQKHEDKWIVPGYAAPVYGQVAPLVVDGKNLNPEDALWCSETRIIPGSVSETATYVTLRRYPKAKRVQVNAGGRSVKHQVTTLVCGRVWDKSMSQVICQTADQVWGELRGRAWERLVILAEEALR